MKRFFVNLTDDQGVLLDRFEVMFSKDCPEEFVGSYDGEFLDFISAPELAARIATQVLKANKA